MGRRGMVASPHYLATGAGVAVLRRGGNAIDAAIATNAVLAVVTPYMCGIGGDLFAQVYSAADASLIGLNGSGRAPMAATPERVRALIGGQSVPDHPVAPDHPAIPARGALAITVPGCVDAWGRLHERFGRLPWDQVLTDAITYAAEGFPVNAVFAGAMNLAASFLHPDTPAKETFWPQGRPPEEGQTVVQRRMATTLRTIAAQGARAYYDGPIADEIARAVQATGGLLSREDLFAHRSEWVEPLSISYRDVTVYELPPNTQGVIALEMLGMLNQLPAEPVASGGTEYVHLLAEVARLAYADRARHLTDPEHMLVSARALLDERYLRRRAALVTSQATSGTLAGTPGDTIFLCTADSDGNLVSMIESNWMGIGSGVMAGETGIMLQNRGHWFSLDETDANVIAPGKRTMHTLIPGMAFRDERPWLVFGTMGGSAQAQIHVELLTRLIDQRLPLDEAIDAPRFDAVLGTDERGLPLIQLEDRFPADLYRELSARGHALTLADPYSSGHGHAHAIQLLPGGGYVGAADPRSDSLALGF